MPTKEKSPVFYETLRILIGEVIVVALTVGVFGLLDVLSLVDFSYTVITGAVLGALVIVLNFFFLARSTDKIAMEAMEARGSCEMDEEEIEKFTKEHSARMNNAIRISFLIRMGSMVASLIIALVTDYFNPIATMVPILMLRPILTLSGLLRRKEDPNGPAN